ncbi:hypothetical protein NRH57_001093 [Providencia rettgeri]|nr:hypothetical protein [Providencia rettgeri]ELR5261191.1 hypothetical protein [Providencia rettgeri]MDK3008149.1 hypothetical protein [Providencia rettgeri]
MGYFNKLDEVGSALLSENLCFCCGRRFAKDQPVVNYDGYQGDGSKVEGVTIVMHASCANAMAQRLILDTWGKRREWQNEILNLK